MKILVYILRVITLIVLSLFICGVDSIYDHGVMLYWLILLAILSILIYKINKKCKQ